ncbi:MAG: M4 family metallopeptidase, partial [Verrucomicrobia bacterium]|nr:M4 family metallopeptidase [Verrucomicrobiota bacterium]
MNIIRNPKLLTECRSISLFALLLLLGLPVYAFLADEKPGTKEPAIQARPKAAAVRARSADQLKVAEMAETSGLKIEWHPRLGTPRSIRGSSRGQRRSYSGGKGLALRGGGHYQEDAIAVMDNLTVLYRMRDAEKEFAVTQVERDSLGFHHVRLAQLHQGLPVLGGQVLVHFDQSGEAYQVNGQYIPDIQVEVVSKIDAAQAASAAQRDLASTGKVAATLHATPTLVVFARDVEPLLAFELTLRNNDPKAAPARWRYWIDANSGKVLLRYNDIQTACPTTNGAHATLTGSILAGEGGNTVSFTGWHESTGYYYLNNTNRHWLVSNVATNGYLDNNTCAYRSTTDWGTSDRAEVSGARNFDLVQRYYTEVMGRNSFDNAGANAQANIHEGTSYVNAYWDGSAFYIGDGDGVEANSLAVLDVCGHEYTHAVTEYTANLIYSDESGALNESFSDIMGTCIEFWAQPDGRAQYPGKSSGTADWLCGEDCWLSSVALRDLRNPRNTTTVGAGNEQPSRYHGTYWYSGTGDNGGVHANSGVQNFFFYLLSEGGNGNNDGLLYTMTGVGITNAQQIACRALTVYCTPSTEYQLVRSAWISAALDLNTNWAANVGAAWSAVGIGALSVSPESIAFRGPVGGPFNPQTQTYALFNRGASPMNWFASQSQSWLALSPTNGTIPANGSNLVIASISATAATLPMAIYTNTVVFSNSLETTLLTRQVRLLVGQPDYFTELFDANNNDLDFQTLTFTPDGSTSFYSVCREIASSFPTDPTGGITVTLGDDAYATATLTGTNTVAIYNRRTNVFYIGSNGYLTMNSGDTSFSESLAAHFNRPRISACFDDLDPSSGGTVSWKQASDRVAVTYSNVREFGTTATLSSQIELFYDGRIRITYLGVGITDGLAGLSAGLGVPAGFAESDLTSYSACRPPDNLVIDPAMGLVSQGYEGGPFTPSSTTYTLSNAGTNALNWSATVTQPWATAALVGGRLNPNATTNVAVLINSSAQSLSNGTYAAAVTFSNLTTGFVQSRSVSLRVLPIPGEILVLDSIPPTTNLEMVFGNVNVDRSRTEHITLTNTDSTYGLVISSISVAGGAYIEDFNDGLAQGWLPDIAANWQVVNGEYRAQTSSDDFMTSRYDAQEWSDLTVQMTCWRSGSPNNSAAVVVRATADFDDSIGSGYVFQISAAGSYGVWKLVNGAWSWLQAWTTSPTINTDTNVLAAVAEGNLLRFYINGTLVWTGIDTDLVSGRIGLMGYSSSSEAATHFFDNVIVSGPQNGGIVGVQQQWYNQHAELASVRAKAPKVTLPEYPGQPDSPLSGGMYLT